METVDRILAVSGADSERLLGTFLQWLVQHESWDALDQVAAKHDDQIQKSKRTLYLLALARTKQIKPMPPTSLARQAAKLRPAKPLDGLEAAQLLVALGQYDWAVREYRERDRRPAGRIGRVDRRPGAVVRFAARLRTL